MGVRSVYTTALSTTTLTTGIVAHSWPTALPIVVVHSIRTHKFRVSEPSPPCASNYDVDTTTTTINMLVYAKHLSHRLQLSMRARMFYTNDAEPVLETAVVRVVIAELVFFAL